jgi:RNA polymerase sigma-70 factor (sigma-E family)
MGDAVADRSGYDEFVAARSARLLRVAYLLTSDWGEAEDLLQTALMKAWFAWSRLDNEPEAYVRRIIATTFVSWRRRRWTSEISHGEMPDRPVPAGTDVVEHRHDLWPALGRLPARQRAVLVLRFFEDLTEQQVAATLGIRIGTVKSQTSKALEKLRMDTGITGASADGRRPLGNTVSAATTTREGA